MSNQQNDELFDLMADITAEQWYHQQDMDRERQDAELRELLRERLDWESKQGGREPQFTHEYRSGVQIGSTMDYTCEGLQELSWDQWSMLVECLCNGNTLKAGNILMDAVLDYMRSCEADRFD